LYHVPLFFHSAQSPTSRLEWPSYSRTLVPVYQTTQHHITEDHDHNIYQFVCLGTTTHTTPIHGVVVVKNCKSSAAFLLELADSQNWLTDSSTVSPHNDKNVIIYYTTSWFSMNNGKEKIAMGAGLISKAMIL
jgi:hypothetical protein